MDEISNQEKYDIFHTQGTAYALEGTSHEKSFKNYDESLRVADIVNEDPEQQMKIPKGYSLNNMGIGKFWYFLEMTKELGKAHEGEQDKAKMEKVIQPYVDIFEQGIKDLKNSVIEFEDFHTRFPKDKPDGDMSQLDLKMKLFIDEFCDTNIKETLSKDFKTYDLRDNQMNVKFIEDLFTKAECTLPMANLGEVSLIFNKMKEAMAFFDVALKVSSSKDPSNLITNKIVSDLSGLVDVMGQTDMMIKMNNNLIKNLKGIDDYVKVFVLRNYGHILCRHKEHLQDGKARIHEADELDKNYPYWAERKL